jgi:hypothetical protein
VRKQYDAPKVTPDEATELVVWHLRMAASLFQIVPEDGNAALYSEIERQCSDDKFARDPALNWADKIDRMYELARAEAP